VRTRLAALFLVLATQVLADTLPSGPLPGPTNEDLRHLRVIADPQRSPGPVSTPASGS
jgi:hypothetical protein